MIISIEGENGVGKSTLLPLIEHCIRKRLFIGELKIITSKPKGEDYDKIKSLFENPKSYLTLDEMDLLLDSFVKNQCHILKEMWKLPSSTLYLADRWITSSIVYTLLEYLKYQFYTKEIKGQENHEEELRIHYFTRIFLDSNGNQKSELKEAYQYAIQRVEFFYQYHLKDSNHFDQVNNLVHHRNYIIRIMSHHTEDHLERRNSQPLNKPISYYETSVEWRKLYKPLYDYVLQNGSLNQNRVYSYLNHYDESIPNKLFSLDKLIQTLLTDLAFDRNYDLLNQNLLNHEQEGD